MFSILHRVAEEFVGCATCWAVGVKFKVVLSRHFKANYLRRTTKANYKAIKKISEKSNVYGLSPRTR
jgi:hypothetical protein